MVSRLVFFFMLLFGGVSGAIAQQCTQSALNMVRQAHQNVLKGDNSAAGVLLDRAKRECPTSCDVILRIASVYEELGNTIRSVAYKNQAIRFCDIAEATSGPSQKKPDVPVIPHGDTPVPPKKPDSPATPDEKTPGGNVTKKWALIVGVGRFQDNKIPELEYSVKDATDFALALKDTNIGRFNDDGEKVTILTNEQATVQNIKMAIDHIGRNAEADDLVVFYFSTHGSSPDMDKTINDEDKTGYIVTYDTMLISLYATAFSMEDLKEAINKRIRAKRIVAFLDTCYSGSTVRRFDPTVTPPRGAKGLKLSAFDNSVYKVSQGTGRVVITSSSEDEESWEDESIGNSYFTYYLVEALRKNNGLSTVSQLMDHLQRNVPEAVKKGKNAKQTPQAYFNGKGELSIVIGTAVQ